MHLAFRQAASLALVRDFCADVVRVVRPGAEGDWRLVSSRRKPHHFLPLLPEMAVVEWRLGEATLLQSVEGDESGNPRDGFGFQIKFDLVVAGHQLLLRDGGWEPFPTELCFTLHGFTVEEWLRARVAGRARFTGDDTANAVWASYNVEEFVKLGARAEALALVDEALARPTVAWGRASQRDLLRALVELSDERGDAQSRLLFADPTDVGCLERVAKGTLVLPRWTPRAAAHVLAVLQPWASLLPDEVTGRWVQHPWWKGDCLEGWSSLRAQRPSGGPQPVGVSQAVQAVRRALGITDVDVSFRHLRPSVLRASDALMVGLDGDSARVRAVVHSREPGHHWTWLWTGDGLEGAVVVSRLATPLGESDDEPVPADTHLAWLGGEVPAARFTAALLEQSEDFRLEAARAG